MDGRDALPAAAVRLPLRRPEGSIQSETFKIMERRLLKAIINPAMGLAWVLGLYPDLAGGWFASGWLHAKVLLVLIVSACTGYCRRP